MNVIKYLLDNYTLDELIFYEDVDYDYSILYSACYNNNYELVELLLKYNPRNTMKRRNLRSYALLDLVCINGNIEILEYLFTSCVFR